MEIRVHGAAGEVTGSAYHVRTESAEVLIDFGMFQGPPRVEQKNRVPAKLSVPRLDAVVLTHAHLDHTGRLPLLTKAGYRKPIHATPATVDMAELILADAGHIQLADARRANKGRGPGRRVEPLYAPEDVRRLKPLFRAVEYDEPREVAPGITVRLKDAGHMLGSASIELAAEENGRRRVVVFSGDLGPRGAPFLRDPEPFRNADLVFLESTYGDREHRPLTETLRETQEIVVRAVEQKAKMLMPVFAVGRTQQMLYHLAGMFRQGVVPPFPIYIDSPLALEATRLYIDHTELFDEEALALLNSGELARGLGTVKPCPTPEASKALNDVGGPCLIMAGSGMCTGGRILHHLRHGLGRPETAVIFVGYQAHGTLGRKLIDGARAVTLFGDRIPVRATVHTLGGFSAHAGRSELLDWVGTLAGSRPEVVLTHGEDDARESLRLAIQETHSLGVACPRQGEAFTVG